MAYDGTDFHGWAAQPGRRTVQGEVEAALATVFRLDELPRVVCAGRTDAGVHAVDQWIHADLPAGSLSRLDDARGRSRATRSLAAVLPADVTIRRVELAPDGFDARFSVRTREYRYYVADSAESWNPLTRASTLLHSSPLDVEVMNVAAGPMLGEHDFAGFCRRREGASTVRTVVELDVTRDLDGIVVIRIVADAFCHSMVRSVVGALLAVGDGRIPATTIEELLGAGQRTNAITVAPPHGLTLHRVTYPEAGALAEQAERSRRYRRLP